MKKVLIYLIILLVLPQIFAININVEKKSSEETMISGISKPVVFYLDITNLGASDNFEFYNLLGFSMFPIGTTPINQGQTKEVELKITPLGEFDKKGFYTFQYFIRGQDKTEKQEKLTFKIIELKDALEIGSNKIDSESNLIQIYIQNKVNIELTDVNAKFSSAFFELEKNFYLEANGKKEFEVKLDGEDFKKLIAGFYTLKGEIKIGDETAEMTGIIRLDEKTLITTKEETYGFIINKKIITKTNEGNIVEKSETVIKKNLVSRLFTNFNPEPDVVERKGATVEYTWAREIKPGESIEIMAKTNWMFPFVLVLLIILIIILTKKYSRTDLNLRKRVSFVRAKGGEFALKITISIHSKQYIERINIVDRLPMLVKIHERFGGEQPSRINEKTRRIEWNFDKLEQGEVRVLSYIVYSKVGVLGRFALPSATAIFEKDGKIKEVESNRAFFVSETRDKEKGEE
ncbi:MAG: hypothetical protein ABH811_02820 [archaeon]